VLAAEHAAELQRLDLARQPLHVGLQRREGLLVVLRRRELEQLGVVVQPRFEAVEGLDDGRQRGALATQLLRALGVVPDARLAQFELDFLEAVLLDGVVKDTP